MDAQKTFEVRYRLEQWFDTQKELLICLANGKKKIAVKDVLEFYEANKVGFFKGFDKAIRERTKNE